MEAGLCMKSLITLITPQKTHTFTIHFLLWL